jgi:isopentenyl-diphosphate delta-isomerase
MTVLGRRKKRHIEVCLDENVDYVRLTTGFERFTLPYRALPDTDLASIDTSTTLFGRDLAGPLLIGAMTGGTELAATVNRNLARAAGVLGIGLMLGSQRIMLEQPETSPSFEVRDVAPDILLVGNLGVAQLLEGYGSAELRQVVEHVSADALALHTNPLQEALQERGDTDFRGAARRLAEVVPTLGFPVLLKEVGHGISARVAKEAAAAGVAAIDVAGAGGTSWAKVEQLVRYGEVRFPELAEWGTPTVTALLETRLALPDMTLIASGGVRSGLDIAKAIAMGATACAVARPLLRPALESAEAVVAVLERLLFELRVGMYCCGAQDLRALAAQPLSAVPGG